MSDRDRLLRSLIAELLGSFLYVFAAAGAFATVRLLVNSRTHVTPSMLLVLAIAHGVAYTVSVVIISSVAPGHINPAVTVGLAVSNHFPWKVAIPQIAAQFVGAVLGAGAIFVVGGRRAGTVGLIGSAQLSFHVSLLQGFAIEAIGTFLFLLVLIAARSNSKIDTATAAMLAGLAFVGVTFTIGYATGAVINPARSFGTNVVASFFGFTPNWAAWAVAYLAGPLVGSIAACLLYSALAQLPGGEIY